MRRLSSPSTSLSLLLIVTVTCNIPYKTHGHLVMQFPPSRNHLASSVSLMEYQYANVDYCPHCLNMGSPGAVSNGVERWPAGNNAGSTVCGDPPTGVPQYLLGNVGGPFRRYQFLWNRRRTFGAALVHNAAFNVTVRFSTFHAGAIQMQLCVIPNWTREREQQMLTNECFQQRILKQTFNHAVQPQSDWWYFSTSDSSNGGLAEGWQGRATTRFRLPSDVSCDFFTDNTKCVLRMYYLTGNTCNVPNVPAALRGSVTKSFLPTCGTVQASYPEEFRNCADILVVDSLSSPAAQRVVNLATAFPSQQQRATQMITTPVLAEPAPLPPHSPLRTCANANTLECFCKGQVSPQTGALPVGFAANPFDASNSSYVGCNAIGQVQVYWCPANAAFSVQRHGCVNVVSKDAPGAACWRVCTIGLLMICVTATQYYNHTGFKGWQCVLGHAQALRKDPSGALQCYSADMRGCASVCDQQTAAPFTPTTHGGALTCGLVLQTVTGLKGGGLSTEGHWCMYALA